MGGDIIATQLLSWNWVFFPLFIPCFFEKLFIVRKENAEYLKNILQWPPTHLLSAAPSGSATSKLEFLFAALEIYPAINKGRPAFLG